MPNRESNCTLNITPLTREPAEGNARLRQKAQWNTTQQIKKIGSDSKTRPQREELLKAARRREMDVIIVWRLDQWGHLLADLVATFKELSDLGVGFVSLTEAIDLTTPSRRALAGMLAVFAEFECDILRERVKADITQTRENRTRHGTTAKQAVEVKKMFKKGLRKSEISRHLKLDRASVIRILNVR